jgi:hypothetical protein
VGKLLSTNSASGNVDINHCADFTLNGTGYNQLKSDIIFRFDSVYKAQCATMRLLTFNCFWYSTAILRKHDESAWFPDASIKNIYWYVSIS